MRSERGGPLDPCGNGRLGSPRASDLDVRNYGNIGGAGSLEGNRAPDRLIERESRGCGRLSGNSGLENAVFPGRSGDRDCESGGSMVINIVTVKDHRVCGPRRAIRTDRYSRGESRRVADEAIETPVRGRIPGSYRERKGIVFGSMREGGNKGGACSVACDIPSSFFVGRIDGDIENSIRITDGGIGCPGCIRRPCPNIRDIRSSEDESSDDLFSI